MIFPSLNGNLVNILPEPVWSDTIAVPRNGGRAVFRSRFADYEGEFVEHCQRAHPADGVGRPHRSVSPPRSNEPSLGCVSAIRNSRRR